MNLKDTKAPTPNTDMMTKMIEQMKKQSDDIALLKKENERLSFAADKGKLHKFDEKNQEDRGKEVKLRVYNGKVILGWTSLKTNRCEKNANGIWQEDQKTTLIFEDGTQAEDIEYPSGNPGDSTVTTRDRNEIDRAKAGPIRTVSRYEAYGNLPTEGVFHEVHGLRLGKFKGTLSQLSRRSRFVREEFVYENEQVAYIWTPYRKKLRLYRPNGSLWMEVAVKVRRPWKRTEGFLEEIHATLDNIAGDGYMWSHQPDYEIRLYDDRGRQSGYGKVTNRQRAGIWRQGKAKYYFLMGVAVSEGIYHAGPDELDPLEVLRAENAQLRAALMKKIGPERLLRKLPFAACDEDGENRLLKADIKSVFTTDDESRRSGRIDDHIAIAVLKCTSTGQLYYLRVPPRLKKVEHARQWLCGIDIESVEQEYIRDRWNRTAGGPLSQLSAPQKVMMQTEMELAQQRERLEFVGEA